MCASAPLHVELQKPLKCQVRHAFLPLSIVGMLTPAARAASIHGLIFQVPMPQCATGDGFVTWCLGSDAVVELASAFRCVCHSLWAVGLCLVGVQRTAQAPGVAVMHTTPEFKLVDYGC